MRILINAISTKKHSGGAYQIAYNFLIKTIDHPEIEWIYVVSEDLDEILPIKLKQSSYYFRFPTQPNFRHSYLKVKKALKDLEHRVKPDLIYSITAPSYFTFDSVEVMRFTNPWVTHPNKYSWASLTFAKKIKTVIYCWNQRRMMKKVQHFITQSETTRQGIIRITGVDCENVKVVHNVLPQVFKTLSTVPTFKDNNWVDIACVGAPVPHKNFDILPNVIKELNDNGINNVRFHVTIAANEPVLKAYEAELKPFNMEDRIVTHGRCSQEELAKMYRQCQLCFLPTLLEVFSASTLEAMYFRLPIVATDFSFNQDVMGDSCLYYEPMNAKKAAEQIKAYLEDKSLQEDMKQKMDKRLALFGDYDKHFNDILSFLIKVAHSKTYSV